MVQAAELLLLLRGGCRLHRLSLVTLCSPLAAFEMAAALRDQPRTSRPRRTRRMATPTPQRIIQLTQRTLHQASLQATATSSACTRLLISDFRTLREVEETMLVLGQRPLQLPRASHHQSWTQKTVDPGPQQMRSGLVIFLRTGLHSASM